MLARVWWVSGRCDRCERHMPNVAPAWRGTCEICDRKDTWNQALEAAIRYVDAEGSLSMGSGAVVRQRLVDGLRSMKK